jgi:hypothetical protein
MPKIKSESMLCGTVSLCCVPQVSVHPKRYSLKHLFNCLPKIITLFHDFTDNRISNVRRTATQVSIEYVHVSLKKSGQLSKAQLKIFHQANICVYTVILH